jgi:hypothetical protein
MNIKIVKYHFRLVVTLNNNIGIMCMVLFFSKRWKNSLFYIEHIAISTNIEKHTSWVWPKAKSCIYLPYTKTNTKFIHALYQAKSI